MKRRLGSIVAASTMALAITAVGAPVAAADATIMFIQGIPNTAVELCVNGDELKSNWQYGGKFKKKYGPGNLKVQVRNKAAGVCKGSLIVKLNTNVSEDESLILVPARGGSGDVIRVFNNNALAGPTGIIVNHAAKMGALDAFLAQVIQVMDQSPTLFDIKQARQKGLDVGPGFYSVWLTKSGSETAKFGPLNKTVVDGKVNHYVAVGTKAANRKLVFFKLPVPVS